MPDLPVILSLGDLLHDPTVGSVEFSKVGAQAGLSCVIRRHEPVHSITGYGDTPGEALQDAWGNYKGSS